MPCFNNCNNLVLTMNTEDNFYQKTSPLLDGALQSSRVFFFFGLFPHSLVISKICQNYTQTYQKLHLKYKAFPTFLSKKVTNFYLQKITVSNCCSFPSICPSQFYEGLLPYPNTLHFFLSSLNP